MKEYYIQDKIIKITILIKASTVIFIVSLFILIKSIFNIIFRSSDKYVK